MFNSTLPPGLAQVANGALSAGLDTVGLGAGSVSAGAAVVADAAASILPVAAAVAIPLATLGVMGYALFGGKSEKEQLWVAQQEAAYGYRREDVKVTNPYSGEVEHFGNYTGPPPVDTGLRRGGRLL